MTYERMTTLLNFSQTRNMLNLKFCKEVEFLTILQIIHYCFISHHMTHDIHPVTITAVKLDYPNITISSSNLSID